MPYYSIRTDEPPTRRQSGAGVTFATERFSPFQTIVPVTGSKDRNRKMPDHRQLLNEVFAVETESGAAGQQIGAGAGVDRDAGGFALEDGPGHAYNEETFQYFLEIERKRSELSNRPFLLMLVDFNSAPQIDGATADKLFSVLSFCLRETDFIGWYREGRVAGAVLTQHGEADGDDLSDVVRQRIAGAIRQALPVDLARQLQTRIYQIPPHVKSESK